MKKLLDCFCGLGGASEGFHREGFECIGVEIDPKIAELYPYEVIVADLRDLNGKDFKGYDVMWGSPPCRDFTILNDARWKVKKNPQKGLELVNCYLNFVKKAKPKIWIMENVVGLEKHLEIKPTISKTPIGRYMKRSFWGNFPPFLMPTDLSKFKMRTRSGWDKMEKWRRAKIPLACSLAFARACKERLLEIET